MTGLLLNLNFAATAASLLILIVKYILRKKTTPRWQLLIWAVLAVQLIVFPFAEKLPESGLSLRNYLPKASVSENASLNAAELKENINDVNGGIKINADAGNTEAVQADKVLPGRGNGETSETGGGNINTGRGSKDRIIAVEMPQGKKVSVSGAVDAAITTIWICGIAVTAFIQIGRYIRCRKSVKELNVCENEKVLKTFEECKNALAIKKEISIYKGADMTMLIGIFNPKVYINESFDEKYLDDNILNEYFSNEYLNNIKFDDKDLIKHSLSILLNYIFNTQKQVTSNINNINIYNSSEYMVLDMFTRVNLELTGTIRGNKKKGSLLHVLDKTSTAMGGRLLRKYVEEPLVNKAKIDERLNVIQEIKDDFMLREDLNEILKNVYDIERICGKIAFEKVTPKEMIHLKNSIEKLPILKETINSSSASMLKDYIEWIAPVEIMAGEFEMEALAAGPLRVKQ